MGSLSSLDMKVYYLISVELLVLVEHVSHCVSLCLIRLRIHNRIDIEGLLVIYAFFIHVIGMLGQLGPQVDFFDGWGWEHGARKNAPVVRAHCCGQRFLGDNPALVIVTCLTLAVAVSTRRGRQHTLMSHLYHHFKFSWTIRLLWVMLKERAQSLGTVAFPNQGFAIIGHVAGGVSLGHGSSRRKKRFGTMHGKCT